MIFVVQLGFDVDALLFLVFVLCFYFFAECVPCYAMFGIIIEKMKGLELDLFLCRPCSSCFLVVDDVISLHSFFHSYDMMLV